VSPRKRGNEQRDCEEGPVVGDNTRLIEWATEVYGIFWGIWVGFSIDRIVAGSETPLRDYVWSGIALPYLPLGLSMGLSLLASLYSFFLIKWLWCMRFIQPNTGYREVFAKLGKAVYFWILVVIALILVQVFCSIGWQWVWMGIWSTLGWIAMVGVLVLIDRRSWR
jgi:hypothetical protein